MGVYAGWDSRVPNDTYASSESGLIISYPDDQKGSKEFVLVISWVHPCPLSPLEMASGTHSMSAPGLTR